MRYDKEVPLRRYYILSLITYAMSLVLFKSKNKDTIKTAKKKRQLNKSSLILL